MAAPRVLAIEHQASCPPAHLGAWLAEAGCALDVCRPYLGDALPGLEEYDALVVLGGSMNANDPSVAWLVPTQALIRDAGARGLATLGICLGHQLCAVALGGQVAPSPHGQQVGMVDVGWLDAGDDPLGLHADGASAQPRRALFWNDDVVTVVPDGATVLAQTAAGDPQAIRYRESVWGVQWHPEADADLIQAWAQGDEERHAALGIDTGARVDEVRAAWPAQRIVERSLALRFAAQARLQSGSRGST